MAHTPLLSLVIAILSSLVTWKVFQAFHRRHLGIIEAQRDHYKALSEVTVASNTQVDARRKNLVSQLIEQLSQFIAEGENIRFNCPWPPGRIDYTKDREDRWLEEWNIGIDKVNDFLKKEMTIKAVTKFCHTTGIEELGSSNSPPTSQCPAFDRQIQNLVDIMERIDAYL